MCLKGYVVRMRVINENNKLSERKALFNKRTYEIDFENN